MSESELFSIDGYKTADYMEKVFDNMSDFMDELNSWEAREKVIKEVESRFSGGNEVEAVKEFTTRERNKEQIRQIFQMFKKDLKEVKKTKKKMVLEL